MKNEEFDKLVEIAHALVNFDNRELRTFHVSFLMRNQRILSIGENIKKTHRINTRNKKYSECGIDISSEKFICSELDSIRKIKYGRIPFHKCKIVNIRLTRENLLGCAAPCESCQSLLKYYDISDIYFSNDNQTFSKF